MHNCIIFIFCFILTGCSTVGFNNLFNDYANQMTPVRHAIENNNIEQAQSLIAKNSSSHSNYLLNQLEQARIANLQNLSDDAQTQFEDVYDEMQDHREGAKFKLSAGIEQTNTLFTNDSVIAYIPAPYEMGMLHSYKALNYIYEHDIENALVETRRANKVQKEALADNKIDPDEVKMMQDYPSMDKLTRGVKNGFQNAYAFYLSALLYQSTKQFDDAYIDYKKALEIQPNNIYLQRDVIRLAKRQGFDQELTEFKKRFGEVNDTPSQGEVIILLEQGLVPKQKELRVSIPVPTSRGKTRFYKIAVSTYKNDAFVSNIDTATVDDVSLPLSPLVYLEALAAKTLEKQVPARTSRQILRLVVKEKIRTSLANQAGDIGNMIASIYNLASEQADTRSWLTLPNQISLARTSLNAGKHSLNIGSQVPINFTVSKQGLTLIYLTSVSNYFNYHVVQL